MRKIDKPKTDPPAPKYLTHEEIELIREACKKLIDRCLVEVMYGSGLRVSEVVALNWDDIDWQAKTITVRDGKGGKSRIVPISTKESLLLRRLKEQRRDNNPWVFQSQYRQRMVRNSLATHLLEAGCPIDVVQAILGHEDISTAQVYAKTQRSTVETWYRKVIA